jgi:DNA-binding Lrp family transcriptional regulator
MKDEFLNLIQKEFPVTKEPFLQLAKQLNSTQEEVFNLYKKLKEQKLIRQTSAIFDTKALGYKSSLVAFKVDDIENAANIINQHPGVSHNYERDNEFNLWFTIAVPPNSMFGLEKSIKILANKTNAKEYLILPTKKMFKIKVTLDVKGDGAKKEKINKKEKIQFDLEPLHYKLIKYLQEDINLVLQPFDKIVKQLNISYEQLQQEVKKLQDGGYLRRFASILYHKNAGFNANAMVVWELDENTDQIQAGQKVAQFSKVSHCYLRPTYPNWPYSLFSMIHAKTKQEVDEVVNDIIQEINPKSYKYLYSTKEFKKVRIKYFDDTCIKWEKSV